MAIVSVEREIKYGNDSFPVSLSYFEDDDGNLSETDEFRKSNTKKIMDVARKAMNYLSSQEIADIRQRYTDNQIHFSLMLGLGKFEIRDYENLTVPDRLTDYFISDHHDPLVFLGALLRYRYRVGFMEFWDMFQKTMNLLEWKIDKKSVQNLMDKWGNYNNTGFYINILSKLGGGTITINDYEKIVRVQELTISRLETKFSSYGKDQIKVWNLKDEIQQWLDEEKFNKELGFKTYYIKKFDPSWDSDQDEKEDEELNNG